MTREQQETIIQGARVCLDNAFTLKANAGVVMVTKAYGLSRSLFILAAEEAIKAHITAHYAFSPVAYKSAFEKAYDKHPFKHKEIRKAVMNLHQAVSNISGLLMKGAYTGPDPDKISNAVKQYGELKYDVADMEKFWTDANDEKNHGLYVGTDDLINWKSPDIYTAQDALRAKGHCEILLAYVHFFLEDLKTPDGWESMRTMVADSEANQ